MSIKRAERRTADMQTADLRQLVHHPIGFAGIVKDFRTVAGQVQALVHPVVVVAEEVVAKVATKGKRGARNIEQKIAKVVQEVEGHSGEWFPLIDLFDGLPPAPAPQPVAAAPETQPEQPITPAEPQTPAAADDDDGVQHQATNTAAE
jgi:hypothetical protein